MKKLICFMVAAVLMLGLCACDNFTPDTTDIFAGTWIVMPETSAEFAGSTLVMNEDGTATLDVPGKTYTMTWQLHLIPEGVNPFGPDGKYLLEWQGFANNPDAIDIITVSGPEGELTTREPNFPVLKGSLNVVDGELFLQITAIAPRCRARPSLRLLSRATPPSRMSSRRPASASAMSLSSQSAPTSRRP